MQGLWPTLYMPTRCLHVEVLTSLDLNSFLLAFSHFTNLRGAVETYTRIMAPLFALQPIVYRTCLNLQNFIVRYVNVTFFFRTFFRTHFPTAFLEHIFQPISINFCQFKINEYCRDSKQYLHEVAEWKTTVHNNSNNDNLYIVAGDVKALYPTISRSLVEKALTNVLNHFSHYSKAAVKILVDLALFCLNNVVIQYKEGFFTQSIGIVTGNNHSVSLANITLHYVILPVSEIINQAVLFKRYIDDIIWLSFGVDNTTKIKEALSRIFMENELELSFRYVNTAELGSCLEFLDVEHKIDNSHFGGFYTRDFVKPTALDRTFLNGKSFHPTHIFKSIVFSEAVRLRRLNETQSDYLASLERLKQKCIRSQFNIKLVSRILDLASKWNDRFGPKKDSGQQKTKPRIIWASSFVNLLKLNSTEKFLVPDAAVVYKKPPTLLNMLTNTAILHIMSLFNVMLGPVCPISATNEHCVEILDTTMANQWFLQSITSKLLKENFSF